MAAPLNRCRSDTAQALTARAPRWLQNCSSTSHESAAQHAPERLVATVEGRIIRLADANTLVCEPLALAESPRRSRQTHGRGDNCSVTEAAAADRFRAGPAAPPATSNAERARLRSVGSE
jgi:hypothetical protein